MHKNTKHVHVLGLWSYARH